MKLRELSDGIIAKQQKAYMKRKKEIFNGYTILMTANFSDMSPFLMTYIRR